MQSFYDAEGVLLHCKRGPFALQNESFCKPKGLHFQTEHNHHGFTSINHRKSDSTNEHIQANRIEGNIDSSKGAVNLLYDATPNQQFSVEVRQPTTIATPNIISAGIVVWNKSYNFAVRNDTYTNQQIPMRRLYTYRYLLFKG